MRLNLDSDPRAELDVVVGLPVPVAGPVEDPHLAEVVSLAWPPAAAAAAAALVAVRYMSPTFVPSISASTRLAYDIDTKIL